MRGGVFERSVSIHTRSQETEKGSLHFLDTSRCTVLCRFSSYLPRVTTSPMAQMRTLHLVGEKQTWSWLTNFLKARAGPGKGEVKHGICCQVPVAPLGQDQVRSGQSPRPHLHSMVSSLACSVSSMSKTSVISLTISALRWVGRVCVAGGSV